MKISRKLLVALLLASALVALMISTLAFAEEPEEAGFRNVQVLKHVKTKSEMRALMKQQAAALGVKCSHCHVPGKFHLDSKQAKRDARDMLKLVKEVNAKWFADAAEPAVTCWTCHRGKTEPENAVPNMGGPIGFGNE